MNDDGIIHINSGVSAFTGEPFVTLRWGKEHGQLTVEEVRMHALALLEAAEGAESDALVYEEMTSVLEVPNETAAAFLVALRERREKRRQR